MRLGTVLRWWRQGEHLTLQDAAEQLDISLPALSRIEHGGMPSGETLRKVLVFLVEDKDGN